MLFTLLMRDEFVFTRRRRVPCSCCRSLHRAPGGFQREHSRGQHGCLGQWVRMLCWHLNQLIPLAGWQILPFQDFVTPLALPVCCIANKISQLLENNLCANPNVTRSCSIWQRSQHHLERAEDNLYITTVTAELSFPHPSKDNLCYISRNLFFPSLSSNKWDGAKFNS